MFKRKVHLLIGAFTATLCLTGCFGGSATVEPDETKPILQNPKNYIAPKVAPEDSNLSDIDDFEEGHQKLD